MSFIVEDSRTQLLQKSKKADNYVPSNQAKGKNRYERRLHSKVANSVKQYNSMDMNKLFKDNILDVNVEVNGETDNYVVTIAFGGFLDFLHEQIEKNNGQLDLRTISRALVSSFNSDNVYVHCSCLHPTTRIKLLDGTSPTVEELCKRFNDGEKLYTYSVDPSGDFKPGEIEKVWVTGTKSDFIKITLDNNQTVVTTPDHLYMLRDGTYSQAQDLTVGQSLMPLYFNEYQNGYDGIKLNSTGKYHSVYKLVAEYYKKSEIESAKSRVKESDDMNYDVAIHHIDFNKHNNVPENLQVMTAREHWDYHASLSKKPLTEQGRKNLSDAAKKRNQNPTPAMIEQRKKFNEAGRLRNYDDDRRQQQSEIMKNTLADFYANVTDEQLNEIKQKRLDGWRVAYENGCLNTDKFHSAAIQRGKDMHTPEREKLILDGIHNYWDNISQDELQQRLDVSKSNLKKAQDKIRGVPFTEDHKKKISVSRLNRTPEQKLESFKKELISKGRKVINYLLSNNITISEENYLIYRKQFGSTTPTLKKIIEIFQSFNEFISNYNLDFEYNHKIINIEYLRLSETPVYDIKVKDYPNFLVDAGVILHNCPDWAYRFAYWMTITDINSGQPENRPSDITNPDNTKGAGCKHVLLVLANNTWLIKVASVIHNYINYMEKHQQRLYADIIYPAIYQKEYEDEVQLDMTADDELASDTELIDIANKYATTKNQFQKGNEIGMDTRFKSKNQPIKKQVSFDDLMSD